MTKLYHITHLRNLPSILEQSGLYAHSRATQMGLTHISIAHQNIQARRARQPVPLPPQGKLHDYVPFYFAPRSPMLYAISKGYVEGYREGQAPIVHLVTSAKTIRSASLPFVFTDGHAVMAYTHFYNDLKDLKQVDWTIMAETFWNDTKEDNDRTRRRNAEFLVHQFVPWGLIEEIGVMYQDTLQTVLNTLMGQTYQPRVVIKRDWYYL